LTYKNFISRDVSYAYVEVRRTFNFVDNRIANLTAEEQNAMHTRMRGKAVLLFRRQATKNTPGMMGERNLIERKKMGRRKQRKKIAKKDTAT